jgi:hypothetical protein
MSVLTEKLLVSFLLASQIRCDIIMLCMSMDFLRFGMSRTWTSMSKMLRACPVHWCLTRKCYVTNIGWASYKDLAEGVRRYDVIFLGFQMRLQHQLWKHNIIWSICPISVQLWRSQDTHERICNGRFARMCWFYWCNSYCALRWVCQLCVTFFAIRCVLRKHDKGHVANCLQAASLRCS